MSASRAIVRTEPRTKLSAALRPIDGRQRPSFRWSDIWRAPLHDFPIRDEILYQYLPLSPDMKVLEIGPGNGFTAFRLARRIRQLTLVDVALEVVEVLRGELHHLPNVRCVCADVTRPGLRGHLQEEFDAAFGLDVFEYLADPAASLRNLAAVLRPQAELFLTFPNRPPPAGDGVTYFRRLAEVDDLLAVSGFRTWQIFTVRTRPCAAWLYRGLHEWPLHLYRRLTLGKRHARPQTYEMTWAFRHARQLRRYKVLLHLWWVMLEQTMRLGGDIFQLHPVSDGILGRQLVIRAWR